MKMLYVLSPPLTPPPSPWTSMRDTSPPLSCPSSNSNSSSSINSSCSYASSQSGRDSSSTGNNSGRGDASRGGNGQDIANESGGHSSCIYEGETTSDNIVRSCSSTSGGGNAKHSQWNRRSFEGNTSENKNTFPHHIRNSQSEKIFPRDPSGMQRAALKSSSVHSSQSERLCDVRDASRVLHHRKREGSTNTGVIEREHVTSRSKQSKATRNWLNAIAKANARGTVASMPGGGEKDFPGKELRGSYCEWRGEETGGGSGGGRQQSTPPRQFTKNIKCRLKRKDSGTGTSTEDEETSKPSSRRLSECYFAVALPFNPHPPRVSSPSSDIQKHLQSMFEVLRPQETLKMAVKLESVHPERTRYLVVVSCDEEGDEACLLGIDCNETTTVGLVLRVLADTAITLDGDGGFSVCVCGRQHIFKPVSVQAMWSALQSLHKVSSAARDRNYFLNGGSHEWVAQYEARIASDRSCLNEWHAMDCLESRRPPSPNCLRDKPSQRDQTERIIRSTLKEIIMSVDLDEVTSKYIRSRLEDIMDSDLGEYKSFIDQEMFNILKQMDAATEIFPHVYLGSEWNASNLEELARNGVCHILNVTREIDNFFPGIFDYLNIRVYDDDKTDLLKHWDNTYKYITNAKNQGSKVLVHCKMGISRSASVVIAYAMKAYSWDLNRAMAHVRQKRNCIKPNANFIAQLETYQGILDAMKNREKLQRSKSETNLKCKGTSSGGGPQNGGAPGPLSRSNVETRSSSVAKEEATQLMLNSSLSETPPPSPSLSPLHNYSLLQMPPGTELAHGGSRPKSWSPDALEVSTLFGTSAPTSQSLERLSHTPPTDHTEATPSPSLPSSSLLPSPSTPPPPPPPAPPLPPAPRMYNSNVRMPCGNGLAYSVSQNKVLHLACTQSPRTCEGGVKSRVYALEANAQTTHSDRYAPPLLSSQPPPPPHTQSSFLSQQIASAKQQVESASNKVPSTKSPPRSLCTKADSCASTVVNLTSQFEPNSSQPSQSNSNLVKPSRGIRKYLKFMCKEKSHPSHSSEGKNQDKTNLPTGGVEKSFLAGEKLSSPCSDLRGDTATSPAGNFQSRGLAINLTRQDSWSSADSAIVSDCVSRQGSWGSSEWSRGGRNPSQGSYDLDVKGGGVLLPVAKTQSTGNPMISHQTLTSPFSINQPSGTQSTPVEVFHSNQVTISNPSSHQGSVPPCSCSSTTSTDTRPVDTGRIPPHPSASFNVRKPNPSRICNCFRRNSDGEASGNRAESGSYVRQSAGTTPHSEVADSTGKVDVGTKSYKSSSCRVTSDKQVDNARGKLDGGVKAGYDSEKIIAATNCISSVILRKKFYSPTNSEDTHVLHADNGVQDSCNRPLETGKPLESVHRQGNSTFYVNNENVSALPCQQSHRGSNTSHMTRSETCDDRNANNVLSDGSRGMCDGSNRSASYNANLSVASREGKVNNSSEHNSSSNTLVVSVPPPRRPLSQTLFNYSNSYPQPFSSQAKLKNHHLSRSYPSVLAQNVSLSAKSTGCDERPNGSDQSIGCVKRSVENRHSSGFSCPGDKCHPSENLIENPSSGAFPPLTSSTFDKSHHTCESQGQSNLNRVAIATSTQSLHSASSSQLHARRDCPKRSLSVEEKRGKKLACPAASRRENSFGFVKNLKHEFEAKTGSQSSLNSTGSHKRNNSNSSCCSCGNETISIPGERNLEPDKSARESHLDNSVVSGELKSALSVTRNINATICDSQATCDDDVFSEATEREAKSRAQARSHEDDSSNNNELSRSQANVDPSGRNVTSASSGVQLKLPLVRKNVPRNPVTCHKSSVGVPPVSEHKKSVRKIVGKFEQKSDAVSEGRTKSAVVDSVTSLMKYIDGISTKREETVPLVATLDATQELLGAGNNAPPPIYNTM